MIEREQGGLFMHIFSRDEHSACGVGFIAHRRGEAHHSHLRQALKALKAVEHRGACAADQISSDGAGIMTDIPFELLGYERGKIAVAFIFMARVCEKNTCPRGIATHDPTFQRLYQGSPEAIEQTLRALAEEVRQHLASLGLPSLEAALGRSDLLQANPAHAALMAERKLDMGWFLQPPVISENPFERADEGLTRISHKQISR
ncbi:MAG: hypothetical protein IGS03_14935 [Candidatus Sericytochromatia bacterium]|nr:hypothetical protein [Candidatus Sericytochromatia bacterium]